MAGEQVVVWMGTRTGIGVLGDIVQNLVVVELRQFGLIFVMLGSTHRHGYLQAVNPGLIDDIALALQQ